MQLLFSFYFLLGFSESSQMWCMSTDAKRQHCCVHDWIFTLSKDQETMAVVPQLTVVGRMVTIYVVTYI